MQKKPIRKQPFKYNPENVFVCDFETTTNNTKWYDEQLKREGADLVRVTYWYMKNFSGTKEFEGTNIESFLKQIKAIKTRYLQLYFHNLAFDGEFIYYFLSKISPDKYVGLHKEDWGFTIKGFELQELPSYKYFRVKSGFYNIFQSGSKIMNITLGASDGKHYKTISINCSLRLLSASVEALGKSYGLSKMLPEDKAKGMAFYDVEPDDNLERFKANNKSYVDYCKRDVEAVRLSLLDFKNTLDNLPFVANKNQENDRKQGLNICKYVTISSLARDLMENVFIKGFQYGYVTETLEDGTIRLKTEPNGKPWIDYKQMRRYRTDNEQRTISDDGTEHTYKFGNFAKINSYTYGIFSEKHYYYDDEGNYSNDVFDRYYKGGLTQFNPNYFEWENIGRSCKLDVSSAYPYHMTKSLPFGSWLTEKDFWENHYKEGWVEGVDYIEFVKVYVKKVIPNEFNQHCCVIPNYTNAKVSGTNKVYRKNPNIQENFVVTCTRAEWDEFQHWAKWEVELWPDAQGNLKPRIERNYMYAAPYLRDMMTILYNLKDHYSKIGDAGKKMGTKILLNSTYGSMALKMQYDNIIYCDNKVTEEFIKGSKHLILNSQFDNYQEYTVMGLSPSRDFRNQTALKMNYEKTKEQGFNKAAAAVITSYERVYLMETIRKIGVKNFGYCDTDSILFVNLTKEQLKELVKLSKSKTGLGSWEFEDNYIVKFKSLGAKKYKTISIPCEIDEEGNDTFYNWDDTGTKIYFDTAQEAVEFANRTGKFHKNNKVAGITQTAENDSILELDTKALQDREEFIKIITNIYSKQDDVYKEQNPLSMDKVIEWYQLFIDKGIVPIIAGNKTAIRVPGGGLIITKEKQLILNKNFT